MSAFHPIATEQRTQFYVGLVPMSDIVPPFARLNGDQASTRLIEPRKSILPTSTPLWRRMA